MKPELFEPTDFQAAKPADCGYSGILKGPSLLAFPCHWQVPAATEKAAYEAIVQDSGARDFLYVGFPWATLVDGLRGNAASLGSLLMALNALACEAKLRSGRRVTVAQHIHALQFVDFFKVCGITDLFWTHAIHGQPEVAGIRIHPFPLYPAQTPEVSDLPLERPRRYLANFIGAYNPQLYLSNVRQVIFDDPNTAGDLLIVKRDAWHFDRAVYEEQVRGLKPDQQRLLIEQRRTEEYLEAIKSSWFTLCPSGSGPNSIRIGESLSLGSIPIILTRSLRLPGPGWEQAAIIEEDSRAGYERALQHARALSVPRRLEMARAGLDLIKRVGPRAFGVLIRDGLREAAPRTTS